MTEVLPFVPVNIKFVDVFAYMSDANALISSQRSAFLIDVHGKKADAVGKIFVDPECAVFPLDIEGVESSGVFVVGLDGNIYRRA